MSNITKFIGAAIVVLLIIIGFYCFRSCSKVKDKTSKEKIELPDKNPSFSNSPRHNPSRKINSTGSNATTPSPSAQTVIDAANSTTASQLDATETSIQNPSTGTSSIRIPPKKEQTEGIVESDQQLIQNIKK